MIFILSQPLRGWPSLSNVHEIFSLPESSRINLFIEGLSVCSMFICAVKVTSSPCLGFSLLTKRFNVKPSTGPDISNRAITNVVNNSARILLLAMPF